MVAMSRRHRLAGERPIGIRELEDEPLIAFRKGSAARQAMDSALQSAGAEPTIRLEGSDLGLIRALAARGFGVAVLPRSFAELPGQPLSVRPLEPRINLPVTLLWRRSPSPAARAFVDFVAAAA